MWLYHVASSWAAVNDDQWDNSMSQQAVFDRNEFLSFLFFSVICHTSWCWFIHIIYYLLYHIHNHFFHLQLFLDSIYVVFTHFLMQMTPLKQLWQGESIMPMLQWHGCTFLLFRSKFLLNLLCLHSSNMLEKLGTPALSSLAYLPTYNLHDHAVYFHINKAHPFKLGLNVI